MQAFENLVCNRCGKPAKEGKITGDHCGQYHDEEKRGMFCSGKIILEPQPIGFDLSKDDIEKILGECLKPEEISGDAAVQQARIKELIRWFHRLADGNANPKWFRGHAFELAYYIATNAGNRFIDIAEVKKKGWLEGINITPAERDLAQRMGFIIEAPQVTAPAHCPDPDHAIEPNWKEELAELRARPETDPYQIAIAKIYAMLMGVADEELKSILCMAFWKQAIEPLVKTVSPAGPVWVRCEQCDGDGYTLEKASNSFATESVKCPYCKGAGKYAMEATTLAQWIAVNQSKPENWDMVTLRRIDNKDIIDFSEIAKFKDDHIELESYSAHWGEKIYHSNIEWSLKDESPRQVFTREQMKEAFNKGIAFNHSPAGYPDFETYMDTNFPNTK